jgi:hypothetical protein
MAISGACGPPPNEPTAAPVHRTAEDVRRALTDAMITPDSCYMSNLDYAVRDPDFLDQVMARLLGRTTLQDVADDPHEFEQLVREAPGSYSALLETEDGLARLSRVVSERFAHPVVTMKNDVVRADYGHIAAKLYRGVRTRIAISFRDSPHLDENWEWRSNEVAAAFKSLMEQHPEARIWELRVLIPGGLQPSEWLYSYEYRNDRVLVQTGTFPSHSYYSGKLNHDFGPYLRGEALLDTRSLQSSGH